MLRAWLLVLIALAWIRVAPAALAQDDAGFEKIELRVTSAKPGLVSIDHGSADGLAVGDRVQFFPRQGFIYTGRIVRLDERSAEAELDDKTFAPPPGTRGEARVPAARVAEPVAPPPPAPEQAGQAPQEHAPWKNTDEEWVAGAPLLAKVRPLRPAERPRTISGRFYSIVDQTWSSEDDRTDAFYRVGAGVRYDNLSGRGDQLNIDGELNYRNTDVPDDQDEQETRLRLDRFAYSWGGNRFEESHFELGRFLQQGLPEFGVLDGLEWGTRSNGGDRYGLSFGFMPEPDDEQDTGSDYQVGGWYRWVRDESETLSATAGYQKTFHDWNVDRDLIVTKLQYLPPKGWTFDGTAWIDVYTQSDTAKGAGVELTQMYANASRRFESGSSLSFIYSHLAFPENDQNDFTPVTAAQLADDHNDRIEVNGRQRMARRTRLYAGAGAWVDEDEEGGDLELGVDVEDLIFDRSLLDLSVFGSQGRFTSTLGTRLGYGLYTNTGRWGLDYEFAENHFDGFSSQNDQLPQHRVRASREVYTAAGWGFEAHGEVVLWDHEESLTLGFYLQRSF